MQEILLRLSWLSWLVRTLYNTQTHIFGRKQKNIPSVYYSISWDYGNKMRIYSNEMKFQNSLYNRGFTKSAKALFMKLNIASTGCCKNIS